MQSTSSISNVRWRGSRARCVASIFVLAAAITSGCSGSADHELAVARGTVTLDGKPLPQSKVMFAPISNRKNSKAGKPAFGVVDAGGGFVLSTYSPDDGAVVGDHWVTVIRLPSEKKSQSLPSNDDASVSKVSSWERVTYPQRVQVKAQEENVFSIDLTTPMLSKYGQMKD